VRTFSQKEEKKGRKKGKGMGDRVSIGTANKKEKDGSTIDKLREGNKKVETLHGKRPCQVFTTPCSIGSPKGRGKRTGIDKLNTH